MKNSANKTKAAILSFSLALFFSTAIQAQNYKGNKHPNHKVKKVKTHKQRHHHKHDVRMVYHQPHNPHIEYRKTVVHRAIPQHARRVRLNGLYYYHHNNVFYKPHYTGGFVVVPPPNILPRMPKGTIRVYRNGAPRYYYNGLYLRYTPRGYVIL